MNLEDYTPEQLRLEVRSLRAENELLETSRNSFREACHQYQNGPHLEIRMQGIELDEIVGSGGFHVEQMDDDHWFFQLGPCAFHLHGKSVRLVPLDHESWTDAKESLQTKDTAHSEGVHCWCNPTTEGREGIVHYNRDGSTSHRESDGDPMWRLAAEKRDESENNTREIRRVGNRESEIEEWRAAGRQFLDSADAIITHVGSDVLPKGWLASANRLRKLLEKNSD